MLKSIYNNRKNFMIIGLTGRIGSGCTTSAKFLSKDISEHDIEPLCLTDNSTDKHRKRYILDNFYRMNWKPFTNIKASEIITIFMLQNNYDKINNILDDLDKKVKNANILKVKNEESLSDLDKRLLLYKNISKLNENIKKEYNEAHSKFIDFFDRIEKQDLDNIEIEELYRLFTNDILKISSVIKKSLSEISYKNYTDIFQLFGDNIRLYGKVDFDEDNKSVNNIYKISEAINKIIKIIEKHNNKEKKPTLIVIDAVRNSLEAMFFKERYSAFYLFAINTSDKDIQSRLLHNGSNMTPEDITKQSKKEHQDKSLDHLENFVSQNIQDCIAKSDIFIVNAGENGNHNFSELHGQIIKYVSLIMHPGIVTPSLDEKMMQIAYTAKLNSGCISRQVGASITNKSGSLKAIGWNSVAEGQTSCLLRNRRELLNHSKSKAYSTYEQSIDFKHELKKIPILDKKYGLNQSFCFKSIHTKGNPDETGNQVHTRSLHAEENAFLQLAKYGSEGIKGGVLYSTASPCELCSKKAYQLGIERIIYIDPYPGIARKQILQSGLYPPKVFLFKGAIGIAYHKLYEQIIPFKDELNIYNKNNKRLV